MDGKGAKTQDLKLEHKWSFWYSPRGRNSKPEAAENYETQLTHLGDVSTIEEFFSYYLYLKKPDMVETDHKMIFFRKDHSPCWEKWPTGGCWILQVKKKEDAHAYNLKWERLLFACISEEFEDQNVIGLVLSVRQKKNLIEIWLKTAKNETDRIKTGEKIRELLELEPTNLVFYFKEHQKYPFMNQVSQGRFHSQRS
jgi:translation initiation factor 4E